MFYYVTNEDNKHYMLANLLCLSWVRLAIEGGLSRHTVLDIQKYIDTVLFYYLISEKSETMC